MSGKVMARSRVRDRALAPALVLRLFLDRIVGPLEDTVVLLEEELFLLLRPVGLPLGRPLLFDSK